MALLRRALSLLLIPAGALAAPAHSKPPHALPARHGVLAATPIARLDLPWWQQRFQAKQRQIDQGRYDLVYYGDSITQNFEHAGSVPGSDWPAVWQRFYGSRQALNLGFKGDTTASLLWRLQHGQNQVRGPHGDPRAAIVLIGANNLGRLHWPAEDTLAGIEADLAAIRAGMPHTAILLVGVLPSLRSPWVTQTTRSINAALAARYPGGGPVTFVDASSALQTDGRTDPALFIDPSLTPPDPPLHPSAEGATRIARLLEPTLARLLAQPSAPGAR